MKGLKYIIILLAFLGLGAFSYLSIRQYKNEIDSLKAEFESEVLSREKMIEDMQVYLQEYETLTGGAETIPLDLSDSGLRFPVHEEDFIRYTSPFGLRKSPFLGLEVLHKGIDFATIWRAQVVSVADGVVIEHWPPPGTVINDIFFRGHPTYGGMIKIDHGDFISLYAHLSSTRIITGQKVQSGEVIGRVGNTGLSTGHHLHFEIIVNDKNVNPLLYITRIQIPN